MCCLLLLRSCFHVSLDDGVCCLLAKHSEPLGIGDLCWLCLNNVLENVLFQLGMDSAVQSLFAPLLAN